MDITDKLCPLARTFGADKLQKTCRGEECALYRVHTPSPLDPSFKAAVQREEMCLAQDEAKRTGKPAKKSSNYHQKAVANVWKAPEKYGVTHERRGYCGMGGKP